MNIIQNLSIPKVLFSQVRYSCQGGGGLRGALAKKIPPHLEMVKKFRKEHGKHQMGPTTVTTMYSGMRGVWGFIYETSFVDPMKGIKFRNLSIPELREKMPKTPEGGAEPLAEGMLWLLLIGEVPTQEQVGEISQELAERGKLPKYVESMLDNFPKTLHPMAQLSCAVTALSHDSQFAKAYNKGIKKSEYWKPALEDGIELIAKIITIAAVIYTNTYKDGKGDRCLDPDLDWSANMSKMMGYMDCGFWELMRLYLAIHCDHEGGNVSAHTNHLVASALSDPFLAFGAGLNGLAGPLHGLANQEVLVWLESLQKEHGENPSEEKVKDFVVKTLKSGRVVPGYGHAALRAIDPRFTAQAEFAKKHMPDYPLFHLVSTVFKVVPPYLQELGKVKNPWPNVDAHSGCLLQYYGMKEMQYYTVLFGVSRAIGCMSSLVWDRAMGMSIERPKTCPTDILMKKVEEELKKKGDKC